MKTLVIMPILVLSLLAQNHQIQLTAKGTTCKNDTSCTLSNCLCNLEVWRAPCTSTTTCPDATANLAAYTQLLNTGNLGGTTDTTGTAWTYNDTTPALVDNSIWIYALRSSYTQDPYAQTSPFASTAAMQVPKAVAATCSNGSPCVQLSWTNSAMAASITTDGSGNQTAGPGSAVIWGCMGSATSCSQSALTSAMSGQSATVLCPTNSSVWKCNSMPQTVASAVYNDPQPYSSLMNYSVQNVWNSGGGVSAGTSILVFQMPTPPPTAPPTPTTPTAKMVTTGNSGPQTQSSGPQEK